MAQDKGNDTVSERLLKYRARVRRSQWLGAGLGAEVAIFVGIFSDTVNEAGLWTQLPALVAVVSMLCGVCGLFFSIAAFDWRADLLQQIVDDDKNEAKKRVAEYFASKPDVAWPKGADRAFHFQLLGVAAAALAVVWLLSAAILSAPRAEVSDEARETSEEATLLANRSIAQEELQRRARLAFSDP